MFLYLTTEAVFPFPLCASSEWSQCVRESGWRRSSVLLVIFLKDVAGSHTFHLIPTQQRVQAAWPHPAQAFCPVIDSDGVESVSQKALMELFESTVA